MLSCEIARLPIYSSGDFDGNYQRGGGNMALTDIQIRNAKPQEKQYKFSTGLGLCLIIVPNGGK